MPANIAEGSKRKTNRDDAHFLNYAGASLSEAGYPIVLSRDPGSVTTERTKPVLAEAQEIAPMLLRVRTTVERGQLSRRSRLSNVD